MDSEDNNNHLKPKHVALFLTGIDGVEEDLHETVALVADDAESRGLFFEWAAIGDMDLNEVIDGTPLHQALTGHHPDR